ncbi:MAG TPA: RNA polymerase sigma-70 factor [Bacteroidales bacterium]|nr:RNA polymerase sigma-70 factor [Bacteroidales bacterium]
MRHKEENTVLGTDFESLFGRYYKPLCAAAFTYVRNRKDAEDIVQQLFVRIWENRAAYQIDASESAYLFSALRNACLNHIRRVQKRMQPLPAEIEETARQAMEIMLDEEKQRVLMSALNSLSDRNRQAFEMVYFENRTYRETAQALDVSVNTIKWHLKTALSSLRNHEVLRNYFQKK